MNIMNETIDEVELDEVDVVIEPVIAGIDYEPIKTEFRKCGFQFTQIVRNGDVAIYHKVAIKGNRHPVSFDAGFDAGFEVVIIGRNNGGNRYYPNPTEVYPSSSFWGTRGWTCDNLYAARVKMEAWLKLDHSKIEVSMDKPLVDSNDKPEMHDTPGECNEQREVTVGRRGRQRVDHGEIKWIESDFTMKDLLAKNPAYTAPVLYLRVQEAIRNGMIRIKGRASHGRGKPTVIYGLAEKK